MKKTLLYTFAILVIVSIIVVLIIRTIQEAPEIEISYNQYPQWHLPDGAKLRLGKGAINKIAFSHDNNILAVATTIGLWLYDGQSGKELALLMPYISVNTIAFSPDGKTLASGGNDKLVRLWNIPEGTYKQTFIGHKSEIHKIMFSSDGKTLASACGWGEINLWDITNSTQKKFRGLSNRFGWQWPYNPNFAFNGEKIVIANVYGKENTIELTYLDPEDPNIFLSDQDTEDQKTIVDVYFPEVRETTFSPDGKIFAYKSKNKTINLRNIDTVELKKEINFEKNNTPIYGVYSIKFNPNGKTLITANIIENTLSLWDVETGQEKKTIFCYPHKPLNVSISPDGKSLASWGSGASFYLWDVETGKHKQRITGHPYWSYFASLSTDGQTIASIDSWGSRNNSFYMNNISTGKQIKIYNGHRGVIRDTEFNPDGTILATCSEDDIIRMWDVTTGKKLKTIRSKKEIKFNLAFSPDGKTLAVASRNEEEIYLWNANSGRRKKTLTSVINDAQKLFFSPDGKHLVSISYKNDFYVGNVSTGKQIKMFSKQLKNVSNAVFSPDGTTLAITFERDYKNMHSDDPKRSHQIELWNVPDATKQHTFIGHTNDVTNAIFSPDGKTLATGSKDKTVHLWDVTTGQQKHILRDRSWILIGERLLGAEHIKIFSFSPDGKIIAHGIHRGPIYLWDTETGEQKKILKGHTKWVKDISFSADGRTLTSMSADGTVLVWDIASILSPTDEGK